MNEKQRRISFTDFVEGKPSKSGNYVIKNKYGMLGTDDYTTSHGGMLLMMEQLYILLVHFESWVVINESEKR